MSYGPKVYREQGGDRLVVAEGGKIGYVVPTLAALGNSQATAAAIASQATLVTAADNTKAVRLPVAVVGDEFIVINSVANKTLPVYPATGAQINAGGANAAFTVGPGRVAVFRCTALLTWYVDGQAAATPNTTELALLTGAGTGGTVVASKVQVGDANQNIGAVKATSLAVGASGAEVAITATPAEINALAGAGISGAEATQLGLITSTAAQIDAAVAGTPLVYRTNVTTALINAGATPVVPAVAGKKFQVMQIMMRANGGNAGGADTVAVVEETAGTVFLSHVVADLTDGAWNNHVNGTPVITGITAGGTTGTANKALLAAKSGAGALDTCASVDFIVVGFYTTA